MTYVYPTWYCHVVNYAALVSRQAYSILEEILEDVRRRPRYTDRSHVEEGVDVDGGFQHYARGGVYNATDVTRIGEGFTLADAADCARRLKALGEKVTCDEADILLMQAMRGLVGIKSATRIASSPDAARKAAAERKRRQRERARERGNCIVNPAHGLAGDGRTTCPACSAEAYARKVAAR